MTHFTASEISEEPLPVDSRAVLRASPQRLDGVRNYRFDLELSNYPRYRTRRVHNDDIHGPTEDCPSEFETLVAAKDGI